jgi:cobaltochelatase CobS
MSRTPSLSRTEAEALIGVPRGAGLTVTVDNRALVRKWLVACGVASSAVGTLTLAMLERAYNDTTDEYLNGLLAAQPATQEPATMQEPAPATSSHPQAIVTPAPATTDAALVALRTLLGAGAGIDENRVRQIIRDELPDLIPVTRLEIKTPAGIKSHDPAPRHKQLPELILAMSAGLNVALVGPAGSGKTTAFEQAAAVLELKPYLQGAVQGAHELLGYKDAHGNYHTTPFRQSFEHGGAACLDELDGGDAGGLLVANSATANGCMAFPDSPFPVRKHESWLCVACMNTYGNGADRMYVGRNQLDAATLDRFVFINWRYDETLERAIAGNDSWVDRVQALRRGVEKTKDRLIISPRASINGAKLLAAGATMSRVEELCIWKGTDAETRRRIETAATA